MVKQKQKNGSIKKTIGIIAALFGVASGSLYEYHQGVQAYKPNDVSDTLGLYLLVGSVALWMAFLTVHFGSKK